MLNSLFIRCKSFQSLKKMREEGKTAVLKKSKTTILPHS